jgi:magnesium-transporting ATPase (P-type)
MYFFRKKDDNRPTNFNLKAMHIINAIAIIMFVAGIIWKLIDWFILKK